jgi:hypothetical protein
MKKINSEIHEAFKNSNVKKWEVAHRLGFADTTFSKKLRFELSDEEKSKILKAIDQIKKGVSANG